MSMDSLREEVRGEVLVDGDVGYEEARLVYNGMIDKRPAVVIGAVDDADVIAGVRYAAENGFDLSIRGGGHSVPGFGTNDDGVVIDLGRMKGIRVEPEARTARTQGGTTWGDLDHATHAFGLAAPGGIISTTGVAGLTMGGGIGYLSRGHGLSIDNLISADVVTADGRLLHANEEENSDLFWAIRGGGGNFGVLTNLEYRLHPVEMIYGGPMFFEVEAARDVLSLYREFIADAPEQFGGFFGWQMAPPLPFIPGDRHGDTFCMIVSCWTGPMDEAEGVLKPFRDVAPVVAEHVGPAPFPAMNSAFDALLPAGLQHYWKANYAAEITDEAIDVHLEYGPLVPTMQSTVHLYPINGACHRVESDATAFGHRDASFAPVIAGMWENPEDNEANTAWVRDYAAALAPHSEEGGYINFMAADDQGRAAANYGANYDRLVEVKTKYDPGNLFHMNQNIVPA
jgi:FAD/FMN-containing dehydrogenase